MSDMLRKRAMHPTNTRAQYSPKAMSSPGGVDPYSPNPTTPSPGATATSPVDVGLVISSSQSEVFGNSEMKVPQSGSNLSSSSRSYEVKTEKGGKRIMSEEEVSSLVHNALRRARQATTSNSPRRRTKNNLGVSPSSHASYESGFSARSPVKSGISSSVSPSKYPRDAELGSKSSFARKQSRIPTLSTTTRYSPKTSVTASIEVDPSFQEDERFLTPAPSDVVLDSEPNQSLDENNNSNRDLGAPTLSSVNSSEAIIRRVEEEIANARKAAQEANRRLLGVSANLKSMHDQEEKINGDDSYEEPLDEDAMRVILSISDGDTADGDNYDSAMNVIGEEFDGEEQGFGDEKEDEGGFSNNEGSGPTSLPDVDTNESSELSQDGKFSINAASVDSDAAVASEKSSGPVSTLAVAEEASEQHYTERNYQYTHEDNEMPDDERMSYNGRQIQTPQEPQTGTGSSPDDVIDAEKLAASRGADTSAYTYNMSTTRTSFFAKMMEGGRKDATNDVVPDEGRKEEQYQEPEQNQVSSRGLPTDQADIAIKLSSSGLVELDDYVASKPSFNSEENSSQPSGGPSKPSSSDMADLEAYVTSKPSNETEQSGVSSEVDPPSEMGPTERKRTIDLAADNDDADGDGDADGEVQPSSDDDVDDERVIEEMPTDVDDKNQDEPSSMSSEPDLVEGKTGSDALEEVLDDAVHERDTDVFVDAHEEEQEDPVFVSRGLNLNADDEFVVNTNLMDENEMDVQGTNQEEVENGGPKSGDSSTEHLTDERTSSDAKTEADSDADEEKKEDIEDGVEIPQSDTPQNSNRGVALGEYIEKVGDKPRSGPTSDKLETETASSEASTVVAANDGATKDATITVDVESVEVSPPKNNEGSPRRSFWWNKVEKKAAKKRENASGAAAAGDKAPVTKIDEATQKEVEEQTPEVATAREEKQKTEGRGGLPSLALSLSAVQPGATTRSINPLSPVNTAVSHASPVGPATSATTPTFGLQFPQFLSAVSPTVAAAPSNATPKSEAVPTEDEKPAQTPVPTGSVTAEDPTFSENRETVEEPTTVDESVVVEKPRSMDNPMSVEMPSSAERPIFVEDPAQESIEVPVDEPMVGGETAPEEPAEQEKAAEESIEESTPTDESIETASKPSPEAEPGTAADDQGTEETPAEESAGVDTEKDEVPPPAEEKDTPKARSLPPTSPRSTPASPSKREQPSGGGPPSPSPHRVAMVEHRRAARTRDNEARNAMTGDVGAGVSKKADEIPMRLRKVRFRQRYPVPPLITKPRPAEEIIQDNLPEKSQNNLFLSKPKKDLLQLLEAATGDSLQRRSNACGALKVLTSHKKNKMTLVRTAGFLDALVFAASAKIPDVDFETALDARNRAVNAILNVSEPKDNRFIVFSHPGLPECLVHVIMNDASEARVAACGALAMLAKTAQCREAMVKVDKLLDVVAIMLKGSQSKRKQPAQPKKEEVPAEQQAEEEEEEDEEEDEDYSGDDEATRDDDDDRSNDDLDDDAKSSYSSGSESSTSSLGNGSSASQDFEDLPHVKSMRQVKWEQTEETAKRGRLNACAAFVHLSKSCEVTPHLCKNAVVMNALVKVSREHDNPIHTKCLEILCNMTRFPQNNESMAKYPGLVDTLVNSGKAKDDLDRVWSLRTLQNLSSDVAGKTVLANRVVLELLSVSIMRNNLDEQTAATATLYNLATEPGAVVPLTNTKNVVATLVHVAHSQESSSEVRIMACDALATLGLWLQTLSGAGTVPDEVQAVPLPSYATAGWQRWD